MDVRDRDFSPMSLHYRDLMTTAIALTNEGSRYDSVRLSQSIACIMTRKIMILPVSFHESRRVSVAQSNHSQVSVLRARKDCGLMKEGCTCCPDKALVFFCLFSPTDCESPHLQNELK